MIKEIYFMARGELFVAFLDALSSKYVKKTLRTSNLDYGI